MRVGENRYTKFRLTAETVASKIRILEGVTGIVFLGGFTRGFTDDNSDVDITIFVDTDDEDLNRSLRRIVGEEQDSSGLEIDFEIHVVREFARREWNEIDR